MTDIVDRLRARVGDPVWGEMAPSELELEAADEIERLINELGKAHEDIVTLGVMAGRTAQTEARLAEAVELLHKVYFASRIDVLMEGPRLSGWNRPELDRLWPELRDLVAKLEGR